MYIQNDTYKNKSKIFLSMNLHIFTFVIKLKDNMNFFFFNSIDRRLIKPLLRQLLDK